MTRTADTYHARAACSGSGDCWDAQLALIEAEHDAHADEMAAAEAERRHREEPPVKGAPPFYCVAGCGCEVTYPNWHCGECEYEETPTP